MNKNLRALFNYAAEMDIKQCKNELRRVNNDGTVSYCIAGLWSMGQARGIVFHDDNSYRELEAACYREFGVGEVTANNKLSITFEQFRAAVEKHFPDPVIELVTKESHDLSPMPTK